jgi:hypothetical protein
VPIQETLVFSIQIVIVVVVFVVAVVCLATAIDAAISLLGICYCRK